jgi:PTS system nitrogen regulatory IIA component
MAGRYLTLDEAAKYLHLDTGYLLRLLKQGEVPCQEGGGRVGFDRDELDAWASQRILRMTERTLKDYHRESSRVTRCRDGDFALIGGLFAPDRTVVGLPSRTKASVLRDLVAIAGHAGLLYAPADLIDSLEAREAACSTGLDGGVALVHPRKQDPYIAAESFIVLARTATAIPFGAPDGENTDLFFLVCCLDDRLHLHTLARLCTMLGTTDFLTRMRQAADGPALYAAVIDTEQIVLERLGHGRA